jgi:hypothetical protein
MNLPPLRLLGFFAFTLLWVSISPAQQDNLKAIVVQLGEIHIEADPLPSSEIPPLAQQLLPKLKSELRKVILRSLNTHNVADLQILQNLILLDLKDAGVELSAMDASASSIGRSEYGLLYDLEIKRPTRHPDLLVVVTELGIPCGSDSSMNLFQRKASGWELLAVDESNGFSEISGAQGNFQFTVSPPDEQGNWFIVTANVNPWCTSNWQQLRYKVLRPELETGKINELLDEKTTVYLGVDVPYRIKIQPHGFEISNVASNSLDAAMLTRVHIQRYRVTNDAVERIPPLAVTPEDFLDEWLNLNWAEASQWVRGANPSSVESWHTRLARGGGRDFYTEIEFAQPCASSDNSSRWQVGLSLEGGSDKPLPDDLPDELYFTIVQHEDSFFMESLATERPPGCPGAARPKGALDYLR